MKQTKPKMTSKQFIEFALKTESNDFEKIKERFDDPSTIRLLHAAMGMCTEAGEFMGGIKKYLFYGASLDDINLAEELGDSDWYKALAADALHKSFEEIWTAVINKLSLRYGIQFSPGKAITRDITAERYHLEKDLKK